MRRQRRRMPIGRIVKRRFSAMGAEPQNASPPTLLPRRRQGCGENRQAEVLVERRLISDFEV
jgi:hypothetical protein